MRTTITLDQDTEHLIRKRMKERNLSFKDAVNEAIRIALKNDDANIFKTPVASMGLPSVNLDISLRLLGELEDEELLRKQQTGK